VATSARPSGRPLRSGCLEDCVLYLLRWHGDQAHLTVDDLPDLWDPKLRPHEWRKVLARWVRDRTGKPFRHFPARPPVVCIAVGWSPRDPQRVRHAVVLGPEGELLFDPHPGGSGVERPNAFYWW
jgi:hypothetical protein